jgi:hypothetical protein
MILVPPEASDDQLLAIVRGWLDALAREEYAAVFASLGYALSYGRPGAECIERKIKSYRSATYYPGVTDFVVTDWRTARGGNPTPLQLVRWYEPNDIGIRATVELDLPLNGLWSDLEADFVLFENKVNPSQGHILCLEEIGCPEQRLQQDGAS